MKPLKLVGKLVGPGFRIPIWLASFSLNILALLTPISILLIFDRVIPFQATETLWVLSTALLVSAMAEMVLRQCRNILLAVAAEDTAVHNHNRFLSKLLYADPKTFTESPENAYFERFSAIGRLRDFQSGQTQSLSIDLPFTVLFAALIALIGGWLFLVPLGAFCVVSTVALIMKRAQRSLFEQRKSLDTRRYAFLSEVLAKMPTVKANRMEPQLARRFERLEERTVYMSRKLILFSGFTQSFGAVFSQLMVAAMGLSGAYLVIQNQIGLAELAACMLLNGRIIQPLTKLMALWVQSEDAALARGRLADMERLKPIAVPQQSAGKMTGNIEVSNLSLSVAGEAGRSSSPISFSVGRSQCVLVDAEENWMVGALFEVIAGTRSPNRGSIMIDGLAASQRVMQKGQGALIALETEPAIFSGTILENLSAFSDDATADRAKHTAAALGLERRINRLPAGYSTVLNANTGFEKEPVNRHLIALTRVLALQPRVLLMNEPTAALDTPERQALADYLENVSPRPTLILSSPDPRLRKLADQSVKLTNILTDDVIAWNQDAAVELHAAQSHNRGAA